MRRHVVITGTGRSGTTFLVELLTQLGLETGFSVEDLVAVKFRKERAGLECDIRNDDCPFIIKNPAFCDYAEEVLSRKDVIIDHIFIPVRDLESAAESRRYVVKERVSRLSKLKHLKYLVNPKKFNGGFLYTNSAQPGKQEKALLEHIYKLIFLLSDTNIPITLMRFPRIAKDCMYLFEKLKPILKDITYESFSDVFRKSSRPEMIHNFNSRDY